MLRSGPPFDAEYYARHYEDPRTRVACAASTARLAAFVCSYLKYLRLPVRNVLDLGCGLGLWREPLAAHFPRARWQPVEWSDHLCARFGWQKGSVLDYAGTETFDLVICQGVLPYLDDRACARALANLARLCRGALYLEAISAGDWAERVDQAATDGNVHLRTATWYRTRLARAFTNCGGGLFVKRDSGTVLFELEQAE